MMRKWQSECVSKSYSKYESGKKHFLCQATPGSGKTIMAANLSKQLLEAKKIDFVVCFSPSVSIATGFVETFSRILKCPFNGQLGSVGTSLTYQSLKYIADEFWETLSKYRILAIFDEIHHCSGENLVQANTWGEQIILKVQQTATYTLALTGTPWRSDKMPISLSSYSDPEGIIQCDYQYTLKQAISDNVCRKPKIVLVDNERLQVINNCESQDYKSIQELFNNQKVNYLSILQNTDALSHILKLACSKLKIIRENNPKAGGLIVASSVSHAQLIQKMLIDDFNQSCELVSYLDSDAQQKIHYFKNSKTKWIVSVAMVSEGTDIPRLQVCCHLSTIKTELYFRQILGRILRKTLEINQDAWLFTFAEESLIKFSESIESDIPESCLYLKQEDNIESDAQLHNQTNQITSEQQSTYSSPKKSSLVWQNPEYIEKSESDNSNFITLQLGKFHERVIEAFISI